MKTEEGDHMLGLEEEIEVTQELIDKEWEAFEKAKDDMVQVEKGKYEAWKEATRLEMYLSNMLAILEEEKHVRENDEKHTEGL